MTDEVFEKAIKYLKSEMDNTNKVPDIVKSSYFYINKIIPEDKKGPALKHLMNICIGIDFLDDRQVLKQSVIETLDSLSKSIASENKSEIIDILIGLLDSILNAFYLNNSPNDLTRSAMYFKIKKILESSNN